ncbi:MAG: hypothetical protein J7J96_05235 [Sulfurimonas sp.]|nr:hypothetical protein [Sulfurimonas sp.]
MRLKIVIVVFLLILPVLLYSYDNYFWDDYWRDKNRLENKRINLQHERYLEEKKEEKKIKHNTEVKRRNRSARMANERYFRSLKYRNTSYISTETETVNMKKEYNVKDFKNKPQIKLGELNILGITSIKPFKKDKFIIKATNGTFALPRDKFYEAEKLNFTPELMKWITK